MVWVSDITYIPILGKWAYLSLIMDQAGKKIVGWNLQFTMTKELVIGALNQALINNPKPNFHHSDKGSQYCSYEHTDILKKNDILISMADTGVSVDNPFAEALNRSVKVEEVYLNSYESLEHARQSIGAYINDYNTKRLHTSIGYMPPCEYMENFKKNVKEFAINSLC